MRIIDERDFHFFKAVEIGQVFYSEEQENDKTPYMRIDIVESSYSRYNAVDLQDGSVAWFDDNECVIPCTATLTLN